MRPDPGEITRILEQAAAGDTNAVDDLFPVVYDELRRMAQTWLKSERPDHTLQPTALVNEAYLKLVRSDAIELDSRAHFFGIASRAMRQILVNHARSKNRIKRGGDARREAFDRTIAGGGVDEPDLVELDDALKRLAAIDERKARVVELRFFGGLSIEAAAVVLDRSERSVRRDWTFAKAWLRDAITDDDPS